MYLNQIFGHLILNSRIRPKKSPVFYLKLLYLNRRPVHHPTAPDLLPKYCIFKAQPVGDSQRHADKFGEFLYADTMLLKAA